MITSLAVDRVLTETSINQYLADRGIQASDRKPGRTEYCCPIHSEDTPSFCVYDPTKDEPNENFYCYGCKAGGTIISLKMKMEGISGGEAIRELSKGMDITTDAALRFINQKLQAEKKLSSDLRPYSPGEIALLVNRKMFYFRQSTRFTEPYFSRTEKAMKLFDKLISRHDLRSASQFYEELHDQLDRQLEEYENKLEQDRLDTARVYAKI